MPFVKRKKKKVKRELPYSLIAKNQLWGFALISLIMIIFNHKRCGRSFYCSQLFAALPVVGLHTFLPLLTPSLSAGLAWLHKTWVEIVSAILLTTAQSPTGCPNPMPGPRSHCTFPHTQLARERAKLQMVSGDVSESWTLSLLGPDAGGVCHHSIAKRKPIEQ